MWLHLDKAGLFFGLYGKVEGHTGSRVTSWPPTASSLSFSLSFLTGSDVRIVTGSEKELQSLRVVKRLKISTLNVSSRAFQSIDRSHLTKENLIN